MNGSTFLPSWLGMKLVRSHVFGEVASANSRVLSAISAPHMHTLAAGGRSATLLYFKSRAAAVR